MCSKISLLLIFMLFAKLSVQKKTLQQVVILSRHNLRTSLGRNLEKATPKSWPKWTEKPMHLTEKGFQLEGFMGTYFSSWLKKEELLPDRCPNDEEMFVYANNMQRTIFSAKAFVKTAFPGCNVTVHHKENKDPVFQVVIRNTSSIFKQLIIEEIQERLKTLNLNALYKELERVLDYKNSEFCKIENKCDLTADENEIYIEGGKIRYKGPLDIISSVLDTFLMQYLSGFPMDEVAWGKLNETKLQMIMDINKDYQHVTTVTLAAKEFVKPLVEYISKIFLNDLKSKVTLLVGHDINLRTIMYRMKFKPYYLPNQYEQAPIGGKVVFQKWWDEDTGKELLKINYIYQSSSQLRNSEVLSLENPPQIVNLELEDCKVDDEGFCLWSDFENFLNSLLI